MTLSSNTEPARRVTRVLDRFCSVVAILGDLALVAMLIIMAVEIVFRTFGLGSLIIADEMSAALLVATTFLGLSIAVRENALFRFDGLIKNVSEARRLTYERVLLAITLATTLVLLRYLTKFVSSTHRRGTVSDGMIDYPLWITQVVMPLGLLFLAIALIEALFRRNVASDDGIKHV